MANDNGGIIGIINTPTADTASGVWSLDSQYQAQTTGTWPPIPAIGLNSARFNSGSSDNLSRNFTSGDRQTFTISAWVKRSSVANPSQSVISAGSGGDKNYLHFENGALSFERYNAGFVFQLITNRVFRDTSAWYHIVVAYDSTQATASNRIKMYVNGVQETSFAQANYPTQNYNSVFNTSGYTNFISKESDNNNYFNGYMSDVNFVDGQALDPTSFGAFNANGVWTPIPLTVSSYGTNGFRLKFENSANLGEDSSPNGNNLTVNNLTSVDQSGDYPVNNFATLNSLIPMRGTPTYSNGNTFFSSNYGDWDSALSTIGVTKGKWYFETKWGNPEHLIIGCVDVEKDPEFLSAQGTVGFLGYQGGIGYLGEANAPRVIGNSGNNLYTSLTSISSGDIVGCAIDLDNREMFVNINGTYTNSGNPATRANPYDMSSSINLGGTVLMGVSSRSGYSIETNFGHPAYAVASGNADGNGYGNFEYTVPSGYYSLCTKNLAEFG